MVHGSEREVQKLRDYIHTELIALAQRCEKLEGEVAGLKHHIRTAEQRPLVLPD